MLFKASPPLFLHKTWSCCRLNFQICLPLLQLPQLHPHPPPQPHHRPPKRKNTHIVRYVWNLLVFFCGCYGPEGASGNQRGASKTGSTGQRATLLLEKRKPICEEYRVETGLNGPEERDGHGEVLLYRILNVDRRWTMAGIRRKALEKKGLLKGLIQLDPNPHSGFQYGLTAGPPVPQTELAGFRDEMLRQERQFTGDTKGENPTSGYRNDDPGTKNVPAVRFASDTPIDFHSDTAFKQENPLTHKALQCGNGDTLHRGDQTHQLVTKMTKLNFYSDGPVRHHKDIIQHTLNHIATEPDEPKPLDNLYKIVWRQLCRFSKGSFGIKIPGLGWCLIDMVAGSRTRMWAQAMGYDHMHLNVQVATNKKTATVMDAQITGTAISDVCVANKK